MWAVLSPRLSAAKPGGRPRSVDARAVCDAIFYLARSGCPRRLPPTDLPTWQTVDWYRRRWQADGTWEAVDDALRCDLRVRDGRDPEPSAAILDSQTVKTAE